MARIFIRMGSDSNGSIGTCKSVRMAEAFNNTCDKWDCPIKCYCAQSEKDS